MSKTHQHLEAAFAGESMARNKYTCFAEVARKEGLHYIAKIFEETADNERRHAKDHFKLLGELGDTRANLKAAAEGEHYETSQMYPMFAADAEAEGQTDAARLFRQIGRVERDHEQRYLKLLAMVEAGTVFKRDEPIAWKCSVCGYQVEGKEPPAKCPCCLHAYNYYEPSDLSFR